EWVRILMSKRSSVNEVIALIHTSLQRDGRQANKKSYEPVPLEKPLKRLTFLSRADWVTLLKRGMNENYYRHLSLLQRIMPPQNLERPINWQSFDRVTTSGHSRGAKQ